MPAWEVSEYSRKLETSRHWLPKVRVEGNLLQQVICRYSDWRRSYANALLSLTSVGLLPTHPVCALLGVPNVGELLAFGRIIASAATGWIACSAGCIRRRSVACHLPSLYPKSGATQCIFAEA